MTEQRDVVIDPRKESYCFLFSRHSCYKLATGRCTFDLTDKEYERKKAKCKRQYDYKARVGYCRELLEMMRDGGSVSATKPTRIYAQRNSCVHMTILQGQHRACIAKKNQLPKLYISTLEDNEGYLCHSCSLEEVAAQKPKKIRYIFRKAINRYFKRNMAIDITDDKLHSRKR